MFKKVLSVLLAAMMVAALMCAGIFSASADETVLPGDQIRYVFTLGSLSNVGGLTVYSTYDSSKLNYVSSEYVYADGMGVVNDLNPGQVNWNDTFAQGLDTNNTDIFAITYEVTVAANVSELGLSSSCIELFDVNAEDFPGDFNSICTPRVEVTHNTVPDTDDTETDTTTDSETSAVVSSEVESENSSSVSSTVSSNVSSNVTSNVSSNVSSNTSSTNKGTPDVSKPTSSVTSTSSNAASSNVYSGSSSAANSSSKPSNSSNSSKSSSSAVDTVKTAGTVAIISLVVVLMAAAAIVFFSKKNEVE